LNGSVDSQAEIGQLRTVSGGANFRQSGRIGSPLATPHSLTASGAPSDRKYNVLD